MRFFSMFFHKLLRNSHARTFHTLSCCNAQTIVALPALSKKCAAISHCKSVILRQWSRRASMQGMVSSNIVLGCPSCLLLYMFVLPSQNISCYCWMFLSFINDVFKGVFSCLRVACEDIGRAAYSQLRLHATRKYNRQQVVSIVKTTEMLHAVQFTRSESHCTRAHALAKVRNFEHVASKIQRVHATAFSYLQEHC